MLKVIPAVTCEGLSDFESWEEWIPHCGKGWDPAETWGWISG